MLLAAQGLAHGSCILRQTTSSPWRRGLGQPSRHAKIMSGVADTPGGPRGGAARAAGKLQGTAVHVSPTSEHAGA